MSTKVPEPEALKLANEYLVALDHDTLENPANALALLIQGVKDGAAERAAAEVSGLRATLKLVEKALPAGPGSPSHRIRALRETLDGVLDALDLTEARDNGHDVIGAARALADDIEEIGRDLTRIREGVDALLLQFDDHDDEREPAYREYRKLRSAIADMAGGAHLASFLPEPRTPHDQREEKK